MQTILIGQTTEQKVHDRTYTIRCGRCGIIKEIGYKHYRAIWPAKRTTRQKTSGWCVKCKNTRGNGGSFKRNQTPWNKGKVGVQKGLTGEKNWNWKGGITPLRKKLYFSKEYREWREAVFTRDNWTCVWCGFHGYVQADHIKSWSKFPKLRFKVSNGRTLCVPCHKKTETYGGKSINKLNN